MVKHTQTILWQQPTNCLSAFDHLVGLALKGLTYAIKNVHNNQVIQCQERFINDSIIIKNT